MTDLELNQLAEDFVCSTIELPIKEEELTNELLESYLLNKEIVLEKEQFSKFMECSENLYSQVKESHICSFQHEVESAIDDASKRLSNDEMIRVLISICSNLL